MKYTIGNKVYNQKPLVLGQIRQLSQLLEGLKIPANAEVIDLISILGDRLPRAVSIVITPGGISLKDKNIEKLASEIEFEISPEQTFQVIEDFFDCNPIAFLLERLGGFMANLKEKITLTGLKTSASSSQEETSQKETSSSGDIPSENASLILSIESEK